jgi:amino acid transporter
VDAAQGVAGALAFFAYLAGFTSIIGSLLAATNSQSRILFSSAREGLLPRGVASVTKRSHTWASLVVYLVLALGLAYVFGWNTDPVVFFGEIATLGTILIALIYLVANVALPFYYRRFHSDEFSPVRHLLLPALGAFATGYPLYELIKPGQPAPFDHCPLIALVIVVVAAVYAAHLNHHRPLRTLARRCDRQRSTHCARLHRRRRGNVPPVPEGVTRRCGSDPGRTAILRTPCTGRSGRA